MQGPDPIEVESFRRFVEQAALWQFGQVPATAVLDAAAHALVDGVESPSFMRIVCLFPAEAEVELGDLLADLDDLGLDSLGRSNPATEVIAAAALCRLYLPVGGDPQRLTARIHDIFGHGCHPLVERISILDDYFDTVEHGTHPKTEQLGRDTREAAQQLEDEANRVLSRARGVRLLNGRRRRR